MWRRESFRYLREEYSEQREVQRPRGSRGSGNEGEVVRKWRSQTEDILTAEPSYRLRPVSTAAWADLENVRENTDLVSLSSQLIAGCHEVWVQRKPALWALGERLAPAPRYWVRTQVASSALPLFCGFRWGTQSSPNLLPHLDNDESTTIPPSGESQQGLAKMKMWCYEVQCSAGTQIMLAVITVLT